MHYIDYIFRYECINRLETKTTIGLLNLFKNDVLYICWHCWKFFKGIFFYKTILYRCAI